MKENPAKTRLAAGEITIGTWDTLVQSPRIMGIYAAAGYEFAIIDMEHTDFSSADLASLVMAARASGMAPLVRPAGLYPHNLSRPLDAGAMGLIVPSATDADMVEEVVGHAKYHPRGHRILQLRSVHTDFDPTEPEEKIRLINEHMLIAAMIETQTGLDNLADICAVPDLDVVMVGPDDLSQDFGIPGQTKHQRVVAAMQEVIAACAQAGKVSGITVHTRKDAEFWLAEGVRFLPFTNDTAILVNQSRANVAMLDELRSRR